MCNLGYHTCPECGTEYPCYVSDANCVELTGYVGPCEQCEYWLGEIAKDEAYKDNLIQEFKNEYPYD